MYAARDHREPNNSWTSTNALTAASKPSARNLPKLTDGTTVRVLPVMLSRCMRGGKTTVLLYVFERLQEQGKKPVFVSFNGDCAIDKVANEKPLATLLRAIAVALMNPEIAEEGEFVSSALQRGGVEGIPAGQDRRRADH